MHNHQETSVELTLFAVPKPFVGPIKTVQLNAIRSWTKLKPQPQIILIGSDEGVAEVARELGLDHIPDVECNEFGTPLMSSVFEKTRQASKGRALCYVNADIILTKSFMDVFHTMQQKRFLFSGERIDLKVDEELDFNDPSWERKLESRAQKEGEKIFPGAGDYFIFNRDAFDRMPPFAIGRTSFDNWFFLEAIRRKIPVFDLTFSVLAVHQIHSYSHHPDGEEGVWKGTEALRNLALLGGSQFGNFGLRQADFKLVEGRVMRQNYEGADREFFLDVRSLVLPGLKLRRAPVRIWRTLTFSQKSPAARRVRERFLLPVVVGPALWLISLIKLRAYQLYARSFQGYDRLRNRLKRPARDNTNQRRDLTGTRR